MQSHALTTPCPTSLSDFRFVLLGVGIGVLLALCLLVVKLYTMGKCKCTCTEAHMHSGGYKLPSFTTPQVHLWAMSEETLCVSGETANDVCYGFQIV